jgi:hypothetical protein
VGKAEGADAGVVAVDVVAVAVMGLRPPVHCLDRLGPEPAAHVRRLAVRVEEAAEKRGGGGPLPWFASPMARPG